MCNNSYYIQYAYKDRPKDGHLTDRWKENTDRQQKTKPTDRQAAQRENTW